MSLRALRPVLRAVAIRPIAVQTAKIIVARPTSSHPFTITRTFASTPSARGSGTSDGALASALASEHTFEVESDAAEVPEFLEKFRGENVWQEQGSPGLDDVTLTRTFGNETLKLTFQVSDLDDSSSQENVDENGVVVAPAEDVTAPPFITCSLLVTKSATPGAMAIDLEAGEEGFEITNVAMLNKTLGEAKGAEGDWARRSRYMGPQFEHLDSSVQEAFQVFLAERGLHEQLAQFILQYCEFKEQKDYMAWLEEAKGFVEA